MASLKIGQKLKLLPILSVGMLVAVAGLAIRTQGAIGDELAAIRATYLPRVLVGQRLLADFGHVQQAFGNAAQANDRELLEDARARIAAVQAELEAGDGLALPSGRRQEIREALDAYGTAATDLTLAMIATDPSTLSRIPVMQARLKAASALLGDGLEGDKRQMAQAFVEADRELTRSSALLIGVLALLLLATVWAGLSIARAITGPLAKLTAAARRVAHQQDLTQRVEWEGDDELADLAGAFDAMVVRLREIMAALRHSVASLDAAAADMRALAGGDNETRQRQAAQLGELSTRTSQLADASRLAADRADAVLSSTLKAESLGLQGRQAADETRTGLDAIRADVAGLVGQIHQMVGHASVVGSVIAEVQELAKQSNVVALNAGIEASRAGEAGAAFGVVAREMRRLADESSKSTRRIAGMLHDILGAARSLQTLSAESDQRIQASNERVQASGASLRELATLYSESGAAARAIVGAVGSQDRDLAGISEGLRELDGSMAGAVESVQRLEASSKSLTDASQELTRLLGQFRL